MYTLALNWLVLVETSSPMLLAIINACRLLPSLVLSIPAGRLADRFERRRLNIILGVMNALLVALVGMALCFKLPFAVCAGLVVLRASVTAAEGPIRNAFLCGVMEGPKLKSAVAQNASVMNLGRIVGPALAGVSLASMAPLHTFLLAALCCLAFPLVLGTLEVDSEPIVGTGKTKTSLSLWGELKARPELSKLIGFALPVMFFGFPYTAMLALFAELVLHQGSTELGVLMSVSAAGALAASSMLGLKPDRAKWKSLKNFALAFGIALTVFAFSPNFAGAALSLFAVGYFGQAYRTSSRMMFQDLLPKGKAGRMMGLALMDRGMIPLGGLLLGAIAEAGGARLAFTLMGLGCLASVWLFSRRFQTD